MRSDALDLYIGTRTVVLEVSPRAAPAHGARPPALERLLQPVQDQVETTEHLSLMRDLIEAGKVRPVIDRTYPLSEACDALAYLGEGHARGKVAITV